MTRNTISRPTQQLVIDKLKEVCVKDPGGSGMCAYTAGWDDEAVAREVERVAKETITPGNVRSLRRDFFGALKKIGKSEAPGTSLEDRLAGLEARVAKLERNTMGLMPIGSAGRLV